MGQARPLIVYFRSFQTQYYRKNWRLQRDSNSDRRSSRRARWPLDHRQGTLSYSVYERVTFWPMQPLVPLARLEDKVRLSDCSLDVWLAHGCFNCYVRNWPNDLIGPGFSFIVYHVWPTVGLLCPYNNQNDVCSIQKCIVNWFHVQIRLYFMYR